MIRNKKTEILCIICVFLAVIFACIIMYFGMQHKLAMTPAEKLKMNLTDEYKDYLFDHSRVHEIDIKISNLNWDYMTKHASDETYVTCDTVVDGEIYKNTAIRPKGNSSLSAISNEDGVNFSFKIEFDRNDATQTYHGLDKLSLGNLGQDPSCMKDFLAYSMMNEIGIPSPLSSFTLLKINGEDFGLYLACEAVEESFCNRNYGPNYGNLYKPDSFSMSSLDLSELSDYENPDSALGIAERILSGDYYKYRGEGDRVDVLGDIVNPTFKNLKPLTDIAALNYAGDSKKTYSSIFDTAVFGVSENDKLRLINAIKTLNTSKSPTEALNTEDVVKYFVVHNFTNNYDSYNSVFVHNFYLHEKDGKLSLVPWDYNLAFGSFTFDTAIGSITNDGNFDLTIDTGGAMSTEKSMINYPIDTPTYSVSLEERPLIGQIIKNEDTLYVYHYYMDDFISDFFESGEYDTLFNDTYNMIRTYIKRGLTPYSPEEFEDGIAAINKYCHLRAESIRGQLDGSIPATAEGQSENPEALIDEDGLNLTELADFSSLIPQFNGEVIDNILNIIVGDSYEHNTQGIVSAIHHYAENTPELTELLPSLMAVSEIREKLLDAVEPYILTTASVIILIAALILVKRYKRRRNNAAKT